MAMLTDTEWAAIFPLLPKQQFIKGGRPKVSNRHTLEAILWVIFSQKRWSDLPREYGAYVTAWRRYQSWKKTGLWEEIVARLEELLPKEATLFLEMGK